MSTDARLALVTGAGSGIGRGCALALGKRGFALAVVDLDEGSARETASQIPGAKAYRADVSIAADVEAAVAAAVADLGPLEVLVNNAGILDGYFNVDEMDAAVWRKVIDVDLTSVFLMCDDVQALIADMKTKGVACSPVDEQRWGSITRLTLPGGGRLGVYQPKHPSPLKTTAT